MMTRFDGEEFVTDNQRSRLELGLRKLMDTLKDEPGFMSDDESKACFVVLVTLDSAVNTGRLNALAEVCTEYCQRNEASFDPWGIDEPRADKRF